MTTSNLEGIQATASALQKRLFRSIRALASPCILPSCLTESDSDDDRKSTAWLDGMRGVAVILVYIRQFAAIHHPDLQIGFGSNATNRNVVQLPFIRLLTAGPAMVAIFFIISGYALSWGPLRALHINEPASRREQSMKRICSSAFRRPLRLFAPGVISTFLVMLCICLGLYDWGQQALLTPGAIPGFKEPQPPMYRDAPIWYQFWDWLKASWTWTHLFGFSRQAYSAHLYNPHLWALQTEWQCSIALLIALMALSGTRMNLRLVALILMMVYSHFVDSWSHWLYFAGAAMAQLRLIQEDKFRRSSPSIEPLLGEKEESAKNESTSLATGDHARIAAFIIGLYLLSAPDSGYATWSPGYIWLSQFEPTTWPEKWRFLHCVGGVMTIYAVSSTRTHVLRSFFDCRCARYFGKIAYAIYLVHGPIVHMLGFWLVPWFWKLTGSNNLWGKEIGWGMAFIIQTPLVIWAADLFHRAVEIKCLNAAKAFEVMVINREL